MSEKSVPEHRHITLRSGLVADVLVKGRGEPLLFLHGSWGRSWTSLLDELAKDYEVIAPLNPGSVEPEELMEFDSLSDLVLMYDELLRQLNVDRVVLVGHSFGGMVAAEFAAHYPDRVSRLVLIDALGLWLDEAPVRDFHTVLPAQVAEFLFADPAGPAAKQVMSPPTPEAFAAFTLERQLSLASSSHFYWPIPDRNLDRRLYRITAPTLLIWGAEDRVVPPVYADSFASKIHGKSKTVTVEGTSHFPHLEDPETVIAAVRGFVGEIAAAV